MKLKNDFNFVSFSQIKQEGENIEFKCRLEEDMEPGTCTATWYFNDTKIEESNKRTMEFDNTYAKLFIAA